MNEKQIIGIIDYDLGNIQSIINALDYLEIPNQIIKFPRDLYSFKKIILPGVGSFKTGMENLKKKSFSDEIIEIVKNNRASILGICLGMQLLYDYSEENGGCEGLGIVKGSVNKIKITENIKLPNIGWRKIIIPNDSSLLFGIDDAPIFYFVHSYGCNTENRKIVKGFLEYGNVFDVLIETRNIFGTQFHPEKSQKVGLQILQNFSSL